MVKIRNFYIVKTVILVSKRFFPIVYGGGIDLKSETDIAKDEVKLRPCVRDARSQRHLVS